VQPRLLGPVVLTPGNFKFGRIQRFLMLATMATLAVLFIMHLWIMKYYPISPMGNIVFLFGLFV